MNLLKKINMRELKLTALMVVLIFSFRSMCFEPFRIPSGSMIPTLNIGDFILVNKFAYGFKLPFSDLFNDPLYLTDFESPKRFDVIVFKYPNDPSINYIKRVIGLPGDEIELINKRVFVNGKMLSAIDDHSPVTQEFADNFNGEKVNFYKVQETHNQFSIQTTNFKTRKDTIPKFRVPHGKYFVMGDNRDFSSDSRYWGFVPRENLKGKALFVWMSLTMPFSEQGLGIDLGRIGKSIL